MKKHLLTVLLSVLTVASLRADVIFNEPFNYFDGQTIVVGTNADGSTNWFKHSGALNDSFVINKKLQVAMNRADDIHRFFTTFTNTQTIVYSSFTVNCTNAPALSNYFAHFYVSSSTFHGRVWGLKGTLPNTWRLGITGATTTLGLIVAFPIDLATNTDYQVVVRWDPASTFAATLWVNPISSSDANFTTTDGVSSPAASVGYAFRQPSSADTAFFNVSNLVVATSFDEAATNVWQTNAVTPIMPYSPKPGTNFVGDPVNLTAVAAGQGSAGMIYQWQKEGANVSNPNNNSNVFSIASAVIADTGNYRMIATTPYGLSVTSSAAFLWVTNAPIPPAISPTNSTAVPVFYHQPTTLHVSAVGPPPITFQWYYTNFPATGGNVLGADSDTLSISDVFTNNGTTGAYYAVATNPYGSKTSGVFTVTAFAPPSIAFLRTLVDPVNYLATNSTLRWQATGTITTFTNLTTGDTSSYYLQDDTAGINIFVTHGHDFRPPQGVSLTFVGWLSSFGSVLELSGDTNDVTTSFIINTNNDGSFVSNSLPAPKVIPFNITNDLAASESLEGSIVMLTNVFFGTNAGTLISTTANTPVTVTNAAGETFTVLFSSQDLDTAGQTLPSFAWSVVGVFNQNLGNAVLPRNLGYQVEVTRFSDIVTDAPPAAVVTETRSGDSTTLSWPNVPWDNVNFSYGSNYSYSVLAATNVAGPYLVVSNFQARMLGINEVPANGSTGTGFGTVSLSADQTKITVNMRFSGLSAPATAAHIHGAAGPGTNAAVLFPFTGVPAATSGTIPEQTFTITPTQLGYLQNGLLYMNVHNSIYPGGEIRGQIYLVPAIGLTSANTSLTNTAATTATFTDREATNSMKFYRVTSP